MILGRHLREQESSRFFGGNYQSVFTDFDVLGMNWTKGGQYRDLYLQTQ